MKIFLLCVCSQISLPAQHFVGRDSLKIALANSDQDTIRYRILEELIYEYFLEDPKTALDYSKQLSALAREINYKAGIAIGYSYEAYFYTILGDHDKALEYNFKSIPVLQELDSVANIAIIYGNIATIYAGRGEIDKSLQYNYKALQMKMDVKDTNSAAATINNIGKIYYDQHKLKQALRCYSQSLQLSMATGNRRGIANALRYLAIVLNNQDRLDDASALSWHAYKIYASLKDKSSMAYCLNIIAAVFQKEDDIGSALYYSARAIQLSVESGEKKLEGQLKLEMAKIYYENNHPVKAEKLLLQSMELFEGVKNKAGISEACLYIGDLRLASGNRVDAIKYFEISYQLAEELGYPKYIKESAEKLYELYKFKGNSDLALKMHERFHAMEDSIEKDEGRKLLADQKEKFEAYRQEMDQKRIEENNRRQEESRIERRNLLQYSFIFIFILMIFSMIMLSGVIKFSKAFAEGLVFVSLLFLFEFVLVLIDPLVDGVTRGIPIYKLLINSLVATSIFPIHRFFEKRLNDRAIKRIRK